jgi:hypothetical protein
MAANPVLDLDRISRALFETPNVRGRLCREYSIHSDPATPHDLRIALLRAMDQTPSPDPQCLEIHDRDVFRAAVRALGSNSRRWVRYLEHERELDHLLGGFDPDVVDAAVRAGTFNFTKLGACFVGQTGGRDARAVLQWAHLLHSRPRYYERLRALARALDSLASGIGGLRDGETFVCVAGFLAAPPSRAALARLGFPDSSGAPLDWKLPGMGFPLVSEFLRNMRWDGFKPDRHVQRLLHCWVPRVVVDCRNRAQLLREVVGRSSRDLERLIAYALAGWRVSPPGVPRSHVDNLVWALGAYVEPKGRESSVSYLLPA